MSVENNGYIQIIVALIITLPSVIGIYTARKIIDIKVHLNSKMDLLLKTVEEKSLLKGAANERIRRDIEDANIAKGGIIKNQSNK
ncbi:MAG: hypothetical protein AABY22_21385 [Nanoarchaeota archaeon]